MAGEKGFVPQTFEQQDEVEIEQEIKEIRALLNEDGERE
jgi:hypothetical protein